MQISISVAVLQMFRCQRYQEEVRAVSPDEDVTIVTPDEIREGMEIVLKCLGLTFEELHQQALEGRFVSERARLTWFAINPGSGTPL